MESNFKNKIIIIFVISGALICANFVFADRIKNFSYSQSFGIQRTIWQMAEALSFTSQNQAETNKKLTEENQKLISALAELEIIKEENRFLKDAINLGISKEYKLIEAEAFGGGRFDGKNFSYEDSVLINRGKKDGIQKGFPVIISGKIIIGKISEVYDDFSRVAIVTDVNSLVDIQVINNVQMEALITPAKNTEDKDENIEEGVETEDNEILKTRETTKENAPEKIIAIAKGEGNFKMSLDMFPKDKDLTDDAIVITSSLSGNYPAGYVIGKIKNPKKIDTETFKQAEIIPAFDPKLLDKVFILKDVNIIKND
ncbi:MAG: rod shape-determining protein MreC [Candidatus Pacebacteria bacterium]|nr:rod shape-determining protein MreC [Candidatus Paceibacterota bacterium]